jgi:hypothetical protein
MEITPPAPTTDPAAVGSPPLDARIIRCKFCQCELAADGFVLKGSQRASEFRDADDNLRRALSDVQAAREEIVQLNDALRAAQARIAQLSDDLQAQATTKKPWYRAGED